MNNGGDNLKDTLIPVKDAHFSITYTKLNKLVTALYMVTDIMSDSEPVRLRLRTLGVELVSDINSLKVTPLKLALDSAYSRLLAISSLLEIGFTMQMISEMNFNILKQEFLLLESEIENLRKKFNDLKPSFSLSDLFQKDDPKPASIGQIEQTRIGVQRGSNLLKALSDRVSDNKNTNILHRSREEQDLLKKERRFEIVRLIKDKEKEENYKGLTITDIHKEKRGILAKSSEKTLQRELVSMVMDGVLRKEGSKRWSRYFLKDVI